MTPRWGTLLCGQTRKNALCIRGDAMKNSPRVEHASMSIVTLFKQVMEFPMEDLNSHAGYLDEILPDDLVQEEIPLFIQQMTTLHSQKYDALLEAVDKDRFALGQQIFNEKNLLGAMIQYFAMTSAPIEMVSGEPYTWHICKGYVLVYRRKMPEKAPDEKGSSSKKTPKNKLN